MTRTEVIDYLVRTHELSRGEAASVADNASAFGAARVPNSPRVLTHGLGWGYIFN